MWIQFTKTQDWKPKSTETVAIVDGLIVNWPTHRAQKAIEDGVARKMKKPSKNSEPEPAED